MSGERKIRVSWAYMHGLNSSTKIKRIKHGTLVRFVEHSKKHWKGPWCKQMAVVLFDGNKRSSTVPVEEIKIIGIKS
jgi:hypothetical protein